MLRPELLLKLLLAAILFSSCTHEQYQAPPSTGYPDNVAKIINTRCAVSGCHNAASYSNAGGLLLDQWSDLFNGGNNGASIVPFSAENSPLLYFINVHEDLGPVAQPTMPYMSTPLSEDEYLTIKNWVSTGAPDKNGNIAFAANAGARQKIYVTMQGCDLIAVIDAEQKVVMRYIAVGKTPAIENPHCVRVSNDGKFAYVSFLGGEYIQKISTETDEVIGECQVGTGSWNVFLLSPDGKKMILSNWQPQPNGGVVMINTETMQVINQYPGVLHYPHGIVSDASFNTFYITAQYGNVVYKLTLSPFNFKQVTIDGDPATLSSGKRDPHEILMVPDRSRYFLTCEYSNEIRVIDAKADTLIKVIPVGIKPQEMAISSKRPYIFVTCMEDNSSNAGFKGSVYAINYNTYEATRIDGQFYQPHGIAVDDQNGTFYVISRNASTDGPAPHHSSSCAGRNGYYHVYDLNTFQKLPKRYEVTVEPYSADIRFK